MNISDYARSIPFLLIAVVLPVASQAAAPDAAAEVHTAMQHAGIAVKQNALAGVHLHLHHTINCLVGVEGEGFDASAGNPCAGMGNGAINDVQDAAVKPLLDQALSLARTAEGIASFKPALHVATAVHELLTEAKAASTPAAEQK